MAAVTYYVDLGADFALHSCLTADKGTGVGALQNLFYGWGGVTKLTYEDTVLLKGVCRMDRFVNIVTDADVSGWDVGDTVSDNHSGAPGTHWTGKVTQVNYAAVNTTILVQLNSPYVIGDVSTNSADGIYSAGETPQNAGIVSVALQPIVIDEDLTAAIGLSGGQYITFRGCASDWTDNGTRAEFDGNSTAGIALFLVDDSDYYFLQNIEIYGFATVFDQGGSSEYSAFAAVNCYIHNNTLVNGAAIYLTAYGSRFSLNTGDGFTSIGNSYFYHCMFDGNQADGVYGAIILKGCLVYENTTFGTNNCGMILDSVIHNNGDDGIRSANSNVKSIFIGTRVTGHPSGKFGYDPASGACGWHWFTYFDNADDFDNPELQIKIPWKTTTTSHWVEQDSAAQDTDYGYEDSSADEYWLKDTATMHNVAIEFPD